MKQKTTLRTIAAKRRNRIAFLGLLIIGVVCAFTYMTTGVFGQSLSAVAMSTAIVFAFPASANLTDSEKAAFTALGEGLSKQMEDFLSANKGLSKEEFETKSAEFLEGLKPEISKADFEALKTAMEAQGEVLAELKKNAGGTAKMSFMDAVVKAISEKHAEILSVLKAESGVVTIDVTKAVGNITTGSGTVSTAFPANVGTDLDPLGNINLRSIPVEQYMTRLVTTAATYPYTEAVPKDGNYTFVAEGTAKPQIDFTWDTKWASPKKIAAWIKLTEESVKDVAGLESVARDLLRKKHDLKKSKALLYADGTGENPKGATKYGRAFSAGPMAGAITNPNFMDIVNACIVDIATTHNYEDEVPYVANMVMVNPVDFFLYVVSAKTNDGVPLYPTASLNNQVIIGGVTIKPEESIPAGKIFVADLSKYNITDYVPYVVKVGYINDDFIKNQFVILAESRFHQFVKKLDEQAFIYDDIAVIKAALKPVV